MSHQTRIYAEQDNNVFEDVSKPKKTFPVRLFHRTVVQRSYPRGYLDIQLRNGYRHYPDYHSENTLISDLTGLWLRKLSPAASFTLAAQARYRGLIDNPRNYTGFNFDTAVMQQIPRQLGLLILFRFSELRYHKYPAFDSRGPSLGIELQRSFIRDLSTRAHYHIWYRDFPNPTRYKGTDRDRLDITHQIILSIEFYHLGNLVRPSYVYSINRSKLNIFSYNSQRLRIQFGTALTRSTTMELYISLFQKYYIGGEGEFPQVKVDPEGEEETKLAIQISQKLPWNTSAGLRYVRCHNETISRNRYYTKDLLSMSLSLTI